MKKQIYLSLSLLFSISLMGCGEASIPSQKRDRANYEKINLETLPNPTPENNPQEIVRNQFGLSDLNESQKQEITVQYPQENQAIVHLTQTGLLDDSVAGRRYYIELTSQGENWQWAWVGRQQKCRRGERRGEWIAQLCP